MLQAAGVTLYTRVWIETYTMGGEQSALRCHSLYERIE